MVLPFTSPLPPPSCPPPQVKSMVFLSNLMKHQPETFKPQAQVCVRGRGGHCEVWGLLLGGWCWRKCAMSPMCGEDRGVAKVWTKTETAVAEPLMPSWSTSRASAPHCPPPLLSPLTPLLCPNIVAIYPPPHRLSRMPSSTSCASAPTSWRYARTCSWCCAALWLTR